MTILLFVVFVLYTLIGISLFVGLTEKTAEEEATRNWWQRIPVCFLMALMWPVGIITWVFSKKRT